MTGIRAIVAAAVLAAAVALAQSNPAQPQQPVQAGRASGSATGGTYAPVRDAQKRPITAGGFVDGAPAVYEDDTAKSGIGGFHHVSGPRDKKLVLEVPGSGVAIFDYDNDGWMDIYLVNGSTWEAEKGTAPAPKAALFRNDRDGTFTDVTAKAGVANERWGFGAAAADFDNDGDADLYVTNFGKNRLYRNNGDGTFTDVAEKAGVMPGGWTTGATWGDYDGDGRLDLFVAGYVELDINNLPYPGSPAVAGNFCQFRGEQVLCGPRGLKGQRDYLYRNNGDGTFTEVAEKAGVLDKNGYYGFGAAFIDLNNDGRLDIAVANDSTPNHLYLNKGDGAFEDASYPSGFALNENGREQAGMGLGVGDYNNDGLVDLYVTNFSDDYNTLYKNEADGNFSDITFQAGLGETTIPFLGWGTGFLDFDNDGLKDVFVANGHVYPDADRFDWGSTWKQRPLLFRNTGKRFAAVPPATGSGLAVLTPARGAAFGSLNNDGQMDVVLNNLDQGPTLLRDRSADKNHWVILKLVGGPKSPRDAIGATVYVTANGMRQRGDVISGGSYSSSSDPRLHFGLGAATAAELEIRWPSGAKEVIKLATVDRVITIVEGKGVVEAKAK